MWWVGLDNAKLAKQTQTNVVLVLGEKIFRTPDQRLMLECLKEMRVSVSDTELLGVPDIDSIDIKSDEILPNGWYGQPYVDWTALEAYGFALEHCESQQEVVPVDTRQRLAVYIRNQSKVSTRLKMLLKGVTRVGASGCSSKKISDVIAHVETKLKNALALGDDYGQKAEELRNAIFGIFQRAKIEGKKWTDVYDALVDVLELHTCAMKELANACQGLQGGLSDAIDQNKILSAAESLAKALMVVCEELLVAILEVRRIAFCNVESITKSLGIVSVQNPLILFMSGKVAWTSEIANRSGC